MDKPVEFSFVIENFLTGKLELSVEGFENIVSSQKHYDPSEVEQSFHKLIEIFEKRNQAEKLNKFRLLLSDFYSGLGQTSKAYDCCLAVHRAGELNLAILDRLTALSLELGKLVEYKKFCRQSFEYCLGRKLYTKGLKLIETSRNSVKWGPEIDFYELELLLIPEENEKSINKCLRLFEFITKKKSIEGLTSFQSSCRRYLDALFVKGVNYSEPILFKLTLFLEIVARYELMKMKAMKFPRLDSLSMKNFIKTYIELHVLFVNQSIHSLFEKIYTEQSTNEELNDLTVEFNLKQYELPSYRKAQKDKVNRVENIDTDYFYEQFIQYTSFEQELGISEKNTIVGLKDIDFDRQMYVDLFINFYELQFYEVCEWILRQWRESEFKDELQIGYFEILLLQRLRKYEAAIDKISIFLTKEGISSHQYLEGLYQLAGIFVIKGKLNRALTIYKKIFEFNPDYRLVREKITDLSSN